MVTMPDGYLYGPREAGLAERGACLCRYPEAENLSGSLPENLSGSLPENLSGSLQD